MMYFEDDWFDEEEMNVVKDKKDGIIRCVEVLIKEKENEEEFDMLAEDAMREIKMYFIYKINQISKHKYGIDFLNML